MARETISIRVELDHDENNILRKMTVAEHRKSKREMAAAVLSRVTRMWSRDPLPLRQSGIVRD
jgi:hypothetical protein